MITSVENPEDDVVSADYLEEPKQDLFTNDYGFEEEKQLTSTKTKSNQSILDELDAILKHEASKNGTISLKIDEEDEEPKENIAYTKISLFDD